MEHKENEEEIEIEYHINLKTGETKRFIPALPEKDMIEDKPIMANSKQPKNIWKKD